MLSTWHAFRRSVIGFKAFPSDHSFKDAAADTLYTLGDNAVAKFEELRKPIMADGTDDALSIEANGKTLLLSRQTPVRQIWVSSPLSGSLKFEYDNEKHQWVDHKDHSVVLEQCIDNELMRIFESK